MGIGTGLGIAGIASAGIGAAGSAISGHEQEHSAETAQQLEYQEQQQALQFQEQQWNTQQANEAPWLQQGQGAINTLGQLQNQGLQGQGPLAAWNQQFQAPTLAQAQQNPGYQFALQQGTAALGNSAAASGNLLTGNTGEALQQYGQNLDQQSYNQYEQGQANTFNRYASIAGLGQTAAGQLGSEGQAASGNVANISLTGGAQQGQQINKAAAAQASGYVGAANSIGSGINDLSQYAYIQTLLNPSSSGGADTAIYGPSQGY